MRIVMLLHKSVLHDSRVRREAKALVDAGHDVTVLELAPVPAGSEHLDGFKRRSVQPPGWVRRIMPLQTYRVVFAGTFLRGVLGERPDAIHAHDAAMLLPGLLGRRLTGAALVYDSHELAVGVPYRDARWARFVRILEAIAAPRCAAMITVSDGIAERLRRSYDLTESPAVVRNVADVPPGWRPQGGRLRRALGIDNAPLVLHQGSAAPGRGADVLVRAVAHLSDVHLVFLGAAIGEREALLDVARHSGVESRVHMLAPVPVEELLEWTADADVGVSLLEDSCDNHRLALPNKVFEYVAAGVPVVVSDLPEMRRFVDRERVGATTNSRDPRAVAQALSGVLATSADDGLRERVAAAGGRLRWEVERERLLAVYRAVGDRQTKLLGRTYSRYRESAAKRRAWSSDNPGNRAIRAQLLQLLLGAAREHLDAGAEVLDVGCGTGWLLRALSEDGVDGAQLTGVDQLVERVRLAREAVPAATILHADAASLPLETAAFDLVFLVTVLSSIPRGVKRTTVLRECARVLRPGGLVVIYDARWPNPFNHATSTVRPKDVRAAGLEIVRRRSVTVAPPIARRLGSFTPPLYPLLADIPVLSSHSLIVARGSRQAA